MPTAMPGSTPGRSRSNARQAAGSQAGAREPGQQNLSRRRGLWFDMRLAIGIGLVVASVIGVYFVVAAADRTTAVYSAANALSAGDNITASNLVLAQVRLGATAGLYLVADELPVEGLVATRPVAAGELIPVSAVGAMSGVTDTSVVVGIRQQLAASIREGTLVDVWAAREVEHGQFGPPAVLIASATVIRISEQEGPMSRTGGSAVEISIPKIKVAAALESIANSDAISLVPISRAQGR